ncbi:MAG TPA: hypothetical protein VH590_11105 [Ktedonobacterales bacterium]
MMPLYELVKARQQELRRAAERDRMAHEANAKEPTETAFMLSRVGSWLGTLALWLRPRGKATSALESDQRSAASMLNLPRLQPTCASHPHQATRADHIPCRPACAHGHVN